MAKGDVVSDLQDIAAAAHLDYQPAAGVETLITEFTSESTGQVKLRDGSLLLSLFLSGMPNAVSSPKSFKLLVNNTRYLRLTNTGGAASNLGFTGVQTK